MDNFFIIIFLLTCFGYICSKKKSVAESNKTPLLNQQGGGRFDLLNITFPFVRHTYYNDFFVISFFFKTYVMKYSDIYFVSIKDRPLYSGFFYKHSRIDLPKSIIIWSFSPSKTKVILKQKGVRIE